VKVSAGAADRLQFLAEVVTREANYLSQTDGRLFSKTFGLGEVASMPGIRTLPNGSMRLSRVSGAYRTRWRLPCCRGSSRGCSNRWARYSKT
jgi:hypothetical protein